MTETIGFILGIPLLLLGGWLSDRYGAGRFRCGVTWPFSWWSIRPFCGFSPSVPSLRSLREYRYSLSSKLAGGRWASPC